MIIFRGEPSGECKDYINKKSSKTLLIGALVMNVGVFLFLLMFVFEYPETLAFMIIPIVSTVVLVINRKSLTVIQHEVMINGNSIRSKTKDGREIFIMVNDITEVADNGTYYSFAVKNARATYMFACQKDLLVEGTLEDFEKLFEGKIVKSEG